MNVCWSEGNDIYPVRGSWRSSLLPWLLQLIQPDHRDQTKKIWLVFSDALKSGQAPAVVHRRHIWSASFLVWGGIRIRTYKSKRLFPPQTLLSFSVCSMIAMNCSPCWPWSLWADKIRNENHMKVAAKKQDTPVNWKTPSEAFDNDSLTSDPTERIWWWTLHEALHGDY